MNTNTSFGIIGLAILYGFLTTSNRGYAEAINTTVSSDECEPGLYPSVDLFGCTDCPDSCENQHYDDIEPCKKACGTKSSTSSPTAGSVRASEKNRTGIPTVHTDNRGSNDVENVTSKPETSVKSQEQTLPERFKTTPSNSFEHENHKTKSQLVETEDSGLSDGSQLAIIITVLVIFVLFITAGVILFWRNTRNTVIDMKHEEEQSTYLCTHSNLKITPNRVNDRNFLENISETEEAEITDTEPRCTEHRDSSEINLEETYI